MKKAFIKKVALVAIAIVTMSVAANAQVKGDMAVGGNLVLGAGDNITNIGIGAKYQYNVTDPLRLEGSFTYFFPKTVVKYNSAKVAISMWDFSANAHYLFPVANKLILYPLAGFGVFGAEAKVSDKSSTTSASATSSSTELCFNIGGGMDIKLSQSLFFNTEIKYKVSSDWNRFLLSVGVAHKF